MSKGILYVMSTAVPGLIKIGRTGSSNFEVRMNHLERNGYSNVTALKREFAIEVDEYENKESLLHNIFSKSRIGQTELFAADLEIIIQLLSSFEGKEIYPKNRTKEEVFVEAVEIQDKQTNCLIPDGTYYLNYKKKTFGKVTAEMAVHNGELILKSGSMCVPASEERIRKFQEKAVVVSNKLQKDIICSSVSSAGMIVLGNNVNGWTIWKDKNGKSIDQFRNKNE